MYKMKIANYQDVICFSISKTGHQKLQKCLLAYTS